ncbi:hypothetical protein K1719_043630 [Acacia pycnantha]|nr:hypothetical protein K1719_043630 [Acacia pycnantha]
MAPKKDSKDRHPSSKPAKSGGGKQKKKKWKQKEKIEAILKKRNFSADNNVLICTWRKHWEPRICMQRHPCFLVTCKRQRACGLLWSKGIDDGCLLESMDPWLIRRLRTRWHEDPSE